MIQRVRFYHASLQLRNPKTKHPVARAIGVLSVRLLKIRHAGSTTAQHARCTKVRDEAQTPCGSVSTDLPAPRSTQTGQGYPDGPAGCYWSAQTSACGSGALDLHEPLGAVYRQPLSCLDRQSLTALFIDMPESIGNDQGRQRFMAGAGARLSQTVGSVEKAKAREPEVEARRPLEQSQELELWAAGRSAPMIGRRMLECCGFELVGMTRDSARRG